MAGGLRKVTEEVAFDGSLDGGFQETKVDIR